jgi:hypothetical protein
MVDVPIEAFFGLLYPRRNIVIASAGRQLGG